MPRRNRRGRRVFDMGANNANSVWNVEIPQIGLAIQDYLASDRTTLTVSTTTGTHSGSADSVTVGPHSGGPVPQEWRFDLGPLDQDRRLAPRVHPHRRGGPVSIPGTLEEFQFEFDGSQVDLTAETFVSALHRTLDHLANPEGQCAKLAFVREAEGGNKEVTVMVTLPPLKKADDELLRHLDRAFSVVIQALMAPVPVDRSRRSIIIDDEETDGNTAEPQPEARKAS